MKRIPYPQRKACHVQEGDRVIAGEALMSGVNNPHDLLMIKGEKALARYLVMRFRKFTTAGREDQ
jgi:hypothetical protein